MGGSFDYLAAPLYAAKTILLLALVYVARDPVKRRKSTTLRACLYIVGEDVWPSCG